MTEDLDFRYYDEEYNIGDEVVIKSTNKKGIIKEKITTITEAKDKTTKQVRYRINGIIHNPRDISPILITESETFKFGKNIK